MWLVRLLFNLKTFFLFFSLCLFFILLFRFIFIRNFWILNFFLIILILSLLIIIAWNIFKLLSIFILFYDLIYKFLIFHTYFHFLNLSFIFVLNIILFIIFQILRYKFIKTVKSNRNIFIDKRLSFFIFELIFASAERMKELVPRLSDLVTLNSSWHHLTFFEHLCCQFKFLELKITFSSLCISL